MLESVTQGWSREAKHIQLNYNQKDELSAHCGCVLWGTRIIVPQSLGSRVLGHLHEGHVGVVKMKALACSYVWWPSIDEDIEHIAKCCDWCQLHQNMPQASPLYPWEWPSAP